MIKTHTKALLIYRCYFHSLGLHTQTSQVEYLEVLDAVADKRETISGILDNLCQKHILTAQMDYVIV